MDSPEETHTLNPKRQYPKRQGVKRPVPAEDDDTESQPHDDRDRGSDDNSLALDAQPDHFEGKRKRSASPVGSHIQETDLHPTLLSSLRTTTPPSSSVAPLAPISSSPSISSHSLISLLASTPIVVPSTMPPVPEQESTKRKRGRPRMYDKTPTTIATRPVAIAPAPLPAPPSPPSSIIVPGRRRKWGKLAKPVKKILPSSPLFSSSPIAPAPILAASSSQPISTPTKQSEPQLDLPLTTSTPLPPPLPLQRIHSDIPIPTLPPIPISTNSASTTHALTSPIISPHPTTHTLLLIDADLHPDLVPFLDHPVPGTQPFFFASPRSRPTLAVHPPLLPPPTYATLFRTSRDAENAAGFELVRHAFRWLYAGLVVGKKVYVCGDEGVVGNLVEVLKEHGVVAEGVRIETIKEVMGAGPGGRAA
ncbi:hypothetical protein BC938DRAFT_471736 [Jimgerdemannia flammicorona]|uniref:Uncharacterized protein n=1 Tax=Jimgerdemannia flammicorona TaxID=994334 RepID=A0A433Q7I5_9FUNG|nr:hypothetical protein BC938DRAFT_471736 [Jimgerdemannia flammicorona]